jgi:hypothetical protein
MGRKIPGRKHRGVRDPEQQQAERRSRIKDKIDAPPTNPDEQQIPKSAQRIAELRAKVKNGDFFRKKAKKPRPKEQFEQYPNESNYQFLLRVNRECSIIKHEAAFEDKFGVEVKKNEDGEIEYIKKRAKDPVQIMMKEARNQKKKKKKKDEEEPRLTKSQKRRLKLAEKKKKKLDGKFDEFEKFQDHVEFGEQAHAPPTLTAPKKIKTNGEAPRPGKKDLLLKSMFNKTSNKTIDRTAKRKDLPNALRRQLDQQQKEVIEAYRLIKGKKREVT